MITSSIISLITAIGLVLIIIFKPSVKIKGKDFDIYWIIPLLGAVLLLAFNSISFKDVASGFFSAGSSNPLKVLVLFFSMSIISIYLDETGFFEYLATITVRKAGTSQTRLFFIFYIMVSLLTVFTSNDIVILTFTPFICKFAKHALINPTPYIVAEFVGANTWSMLLVIGNPTNIYLATAAEIGFIEYLKIMILPTILGGVSGLVVLYLIFRKSLSTPINCDVEKGKIEHKSLAIIGLIHLLLCTLTLAISSYFDLEMWLIALAFAVSLFIFVTVYRVLKKQKPTILLKTVKRLPWQLAPTVIGMFVLVLALMKSGATVKIAELLGDGAVIAKYGVISTLMCNVMNNIPMSVLFSNICSSLGGVSMQKAVYSTVIGSNLGALVTPVGALAGIMFTKLLARHEVKFGFKQFICYGFVTMSVSLLFSLFGLAIVFVL